MADGQSAVGKSDVPREHRFSVLCFNPLPSSPWVSDKLPSLPRFRSLQVRKCNLYRTKLLINS